MVKKRRLISSDSVTMCRINELSDDLLVLILSKLTMKEAARTSVLSHRWDNLWVYYAGSLNFHPVDAMLDRSNIARPRLISWVNHVLNLHRASTVDEFRVCFRLDESNGDVIERWIKFAMEKRISRFELDFSGLYGIVFTHYSFEFPSKLLDSPDNFGSLTSLRLNSVNLTDKVLAYFISNCRSLEQLSIIAASLLTYINATTASKLKLLEIKYCINLQNVDISNTNIETLKFEGKRETKLSLEQLNLLSEVSLNGYWGSRVFAHEFELLPISQLQRLELNLGFFVSMGIVKFAKKFPTFCNLKHLKVILGVRQDQNIFCLTSLICAAPLLTSFTLKLYYSTDDPCPGLLELPNCEWRNLENRTHEYLKVVEIIGWFGRNSELDLVYYLFMRSVVLEKVVIDPGQLTGNGHKTALHEQIESVSRERAKLLQNYVPPGMEFVIL